MKAFKTFWKDYTELCKQSGEWYKKHWKGALVLNAAIVAAEFAWFYKDEIKDKVHEKLESKKSKEESQA